MKFACVRCGDTMEDGYLDPCVSCKHLEHAMKCNPQVEGGDLGGVCQFNLAELLETFRKQILKEVRDEIQGHSSDPFLHPREY